VVKEQKAFTFAYVMNGLSPRLEPDRGFRLVKELVSRLRRLANESCFYANEYSTYKKFKKEEGAAWISAIS
jgi:hypothetical protein